MNRWDGYSNLSHASADQRATKFAEYLSKKESRPNIDSSLQYSAGNMRAQLKMTKAYYSEKFIEKLCALVDDTNFSFETMLSNASGNLGNIYSSVSGTINKNQIKNDIRAACWKAFEPFYSQAQTEISKVEKQQIAREKADRGRENSYRRYR